MRPKTSFFIWVVSVALGIGSSGFCATTNPENAPISTGTWRYAELPGFEILSDRPDERTQQWIAGLRRQLQLFSHIFPNDFLRPMDVPVIVILYSAEHDALPAQRYSGKALSPQPAAPTPPLPTGNSAKQSGTRARAFQLGSSTRSSGITRKVDDDMMLLLHNLWDAEANDLAMTLTPKSGGGGSQFAMYANYLLQERLPGPPLWLALGLRSLFDRAMFQWNGISFSNLRTPVGSGAHKLLPWDEFFARDPFHGDPKLGAADATGIWLWQAELFVAWGLTTEGQRHQAGFGKFLQRAVTERVTETMFQECFGLTFATAGEQMSRLLDRSPRSAPEFLNASLPDLPGLVLRDATSSEFLGLTGEAARIHALRPTQPKGESAESSGTQVRDTLIRSHTDGDRDPRLLAAIGLHEIAAENHLRAREFLEASAAAGVVRPRVYLELAQLRLAEARRQSEGEGRFNKSQTAFVLDPLATARRQTPRREKTYLLIAEVWAGSATAPATEDFAALEEGLRFFPTSAELSLKTAELRAKNGFTAEARAIIERSLPFPHSVEIRARLERLQANLKPGE